MNHLKPTGTFLAIIAAMAWVCPRKAMAEPPSVVTTQDVQLGAGGELQGEVVNAVGYALPEQLVVIRRQGAEVAQARTDAEGRFVVQNLQGGLYEISTEQTTAAYRLWAPRTAPPAASDGIRMISAPTVYRGQSVPPLMDYPTPVVVGVGLGIAAAIAIPIVVVNQDDGFD